MVFSDFIHSNLYINLEINNETITYFNKKYFAKKIPIEKLLEGSPRIIHDTFLFPCYWKLVSPNKLVYINHAIEKQFFFLETLHYVLEDYFIKNKIYVSGFIHGNDGVFDDPFRVEIINNIINF